MNKGRNSGLPQLVYLASTKELRKPKCSYYLRKKNNFNILRLPSWNHGCWLKRAYRLGDGSLGLNQDSCRKETLSPQSGSRSAGTVPTVHPHVWNGYESGLPCLFLTPETPTGRPTGPVQGRFGGICGGLRLNSGGL